jgi:predicted metal-dependent hydrolase
MPPPLYLPEVPPPPSAYLPGRTPHPNQAAGARPEPPPPLDPARWPESRAYLRGIDLFNHGYYWEAHEEWEGLWHAAGRRGPSADFLKGLIKLAAAGVKVRQGRPDGVVSHARRAAALFRQTAQALGGAAARYLGLGLGDLIDFSRAAEGQAAARPDEAPGPRVVFDFVLRPERG